VKSARIMKMNIPNFHDGYFDGLQISANKLVHIFLRTQDGKSFVLVLQGVDALTFSEIKLGNIIFDVVFRSTQELTSADMFDLFSIGADTLKASDLLNAKREQGLKLLEINASYGAQGLVLFQNFDMHESNPD
jgi:hypothetical protein